MSEAKIILVRHGETYLNKYNRMQGWADSPLTSEAIEVIRKSAKSLSNYSISAVYSSDTMRTQQTAEIMIDEIKHLQKENLEIKLDSNLREICFGSFEGEKSNVAWSKISDSLGYSSMEEMFENENISSVYDEISRVDESNDAENSSQFFERILKSFHQIALENSGKTVLVITHGNVIRSIITNFINGGTVHKDISNGQSFVIEYSNGNFSFERNE